MNRAFKVILNFNAAFTVSGITVIKATLCYLTVAPLCFPVLLFVTVILWVHKLLLAQ